MSDVTKIIREASDKIWNAGEKLTHNQIDEIVASAVSQARSEWVQEAREEIMSSPEYRRSGVSPLKDVIDRVLPALQVEEECER